MGLQVRRLAHGLGAEVRGVDLLRLDAAAWEAIHAVWMEHLVLVFPQQKLTGLEFAAFSARFGALEVLGSGQQDCVRLDAGLIAQAAEAIARSGNLGGREHQPPAGIFEINGC
ncbi:MAG: TauD/TfdA family dioxygenase, partial [Rubrivivax sp.]|nr:TauD/TfdA family dioxygenase [Rubrivivax sp.]